MSLDVTIYRKGIIHWNDGEQSSHEEEYYSDNITHNLNIMAEAADIYAYLWYPEEVDVQYAEDLIEPLTKGLAKLKYDPEYYMIFNPKNGWGTYERLVEFVENYLIACKEYPNYEIVVDR